MCVSKFPTGVLGEPSPYLQPKTALRRLSDREKAKKVQCSAANEDDSVNSNVVTRAGKKAPVPEAVLT